MKTNMTLSGKLMKGIAIFILSVVFLQHLAGQENQKFNLKAQNDKGQSDEIVFIIYHDSLALEMLYPKLPPGELESGFSFYALNKGNDRHAIPLSGYALDSDSIISLGLSSGESGTYEIEIKPSCESGNYFFYLIDCSEQKITELNSTVNYSFSCQAGTYQERFKILVSNNACETEESRKKICCDTAPIPQPEEVGDTVVNVSDTNVTDISENSPFPHPEETIYDNVPDLPPGEENDTSRSPLPRPEETITGEMPDLPAEEESNDSASLVKQPGEITDTTSNTPLDKVNSTIYETSGDSLLSDIQNDSNTTQNSDSIEVQPSMGFSEENESETIAGEGDIIYPDLPPQEHFDTLNTTTIENEESMKNDTLPVFVDSAGLNSGQPEMDEYPLEMTETTDTTTNSYGNCEAETGSNHPPEDQNVKENDSYNISEVQTSQKDDSKNVEKTTSAVHLPAKNTTTMTYIQQGRTITVYHLDNEGYNGKWMLRVISITGKVVETLPFRDNECTVNLLNPGIYILAAYSGDEMTTRKIVVE